MDRDRPIQLVVIIGSIRVHRLGESVGRWFVRRAEERDDYVVDVVDLASAGLPWDFSDTPARADYRARLERADAFVVVTPEYNHSFPASLKHAIDLASPEWHAKPVAFVSYGSMAGGLRSVEHLRAVFAELHAITIRDTVSLHNPWDLFDDDAEMTEDVGAEEPTQVLLDQLAWWARALRAARDAEPYTT